MATKGKKIKQINKKNAEQKAAAAPCPPPHLQMSAGCCLIRAGSSVTPRGDSAVPSPAHTGEGGHGSSPPNKAPEPGNSAREIQPGNSARSQQHFHANERCRFHPAARGKLERKSSLDKDATFMSDRRGWAPTPILSPSVYF